LAGDGTEQEKRASSEREDGATETRKETV